MDVINKPLLTMNGTVMSLVSPDKVAIVAIVFPSASVIDRKSADTEAMLMLKIKADSPAGTIVLSSKEESPKTWICRVATPEGIGVLLFSLVNNTVCLFDQANWSNIRKYVNQYKTLLAT
jgi:hypothetical protein